jgi:hypothetical protein
MSTLSDFAYQLERMVADHGFTAISAGLVPLFISTTR